MIGEKIYKAEFSQEEYTKLVLWCSSNNAHMEDKGEYYEVVENAPEPEPTVEQQLIALELKYDMNRWQREIILSEGSGASDYVKGIAEQIEELAKQVRK